ncbi:MAG: hypothetical protein Q7V88_07675 [Actinomycetota bacterium]|nr:hypothetical protein [Actinomycetota bacterium]
MKSFQGLVAGLQTSGPWLLRGGLVVVGLALWVYIMWRRRSAEGKSTQTRSTLLPSSSPDGYGGESTKCSVVGRRVFRSVGASSFVFLWVAVTVLSQVALAAVAVGMAWSPVAGVIVAACAVGLCVVRVVRLCVVVEGESQIVVCNFFRTYRFNSGEVRRVDEAMPRRGRVITRGIDVDWWLCIELTSGKKVFPSALLRKTNRDDHVEFAQAVGLQI